MRIALLDDEPAELALIERALAVELDNWIEPVVCHPFLRGQDLLARLRRETFDLLILDWNLPDLGGDEILFWMRRYQKIRTPIIMLTSCESEVDVVKALEIGADDYILKPFRPRELRARVRKVMRHTGTPLSSERGALVFGNISFDEGTITAKLISGNVVLTEMEFRLALFLFRNIGKNISRAHLAEMVLGHNEEMSTRSLDTHVYRLRRKLNLTAENGWQLITIYGHGYRLEPSA